MKRSIAATIAVVGCVTLLSGCGSGTPTPGNTPVQQNTPASAPDPKAVWVDVWEYDAITKRCDGTTMIYRDAGVRERSITAVPLHPECME